MSADQTETNEYDAETDNKKTQIIGWLQIILVFAVLAAGLAANALLSSGSTDPRQRAIGATSIPVEVYLPEVLDKPFRVNGSGVIQSRNIIDLSPQVSGRVVAVSPNLASGGRFEAGEVLFKLDRANYSAALERAQADLSSAQADLRVERAEADVAIAEWRLVNPNEAVPPLVAREPQISQAQAAVESAQSAVQDARLDLGRLSFTLPFEGRIVSTTIDVGQNLISGQSYGSVYDGKDIEIAVSLNADSLNFLSPIEGRSALIVARGTRPGTEQRFLAKIERADAELNSETRQATVILTFQEETGLLPGAFVQAIIEGPVIKRAHLIPEKAISDDLTVWVVVDGALAPRKPNFYYPDEDGLVVTAAFDIGEGLVISPLNNPIAGTAVNILNAGTTETTTP